MCASLAIHIRLSHLLCATEVQILHALYFFLLPKMRTNHLRASRLEHKVLTTYVHSDLIFTLQQRYTLQEPQGRMIYKHARRVERVL